jgi:hypothetical protein
VPLDTPGSNTSLVVSPPAALPTITLNQAQPISGDVTVSNGSGGTHSARDLQSQTQYSSGMFVLNNSAARQAFH